MVLYHKFQLPAEVVGKPRIDLKGLLFDNTCCMVRLLMLSRIPMVWFAGLRSVWNE